jgi:hypothetical protein
MCDEGLALKKQVGRVLGEIDMRTNQLCFAKKTQPKDRFARFGHHKKERGWP